MELKLVLSILIFAIVMLILLNFKWKEMKEIKEEALKKEKPKEEKPTLPPLETLEEESDLRKVLEKFQKEENKLLVPLGFNTNHELQVMDLEKSNNLLIIGTTGGGKSICLNEIISSIIMNYQREEINFVTMDTSIVELSTFNTIPHYLKETLSRPQEILEELTVLLKEADKRIKSPQHPSLIVVIDDLYDVANYSKEALEKIEQLLRMSKEANMHFIIATDTPTQEILTKNLQKEIGTTLYLTLSPGEEKEFSFEKELTEEELSFLTTIGNLIYQENNHKEKVVVPDVTEKEIKKIKDWFNPYR